MCQPIGFVDPNAPDFVCKLAKFLYGLKQAPRAWFEKLCQALIHLGFTSTKFDTYLFINITLQEYFTYILIYVDDFLLTNNNETFL